MNRGPDRAFWYRRMLLLIKYSKCPISDVVVFSNFSGANLMTMLYHWWVVGWIFCPFMSVPIFLTFLSHIQYLRRSSSLSFAALAMLISYLTLVTLIFTSLIYGIACIVIFFCYKNVKKNCREVVIEGWFTPFWCIGIGIGKSLMFNYFPAY